MATNTNPYRPAGGADGLVLEPIHIDNLKVGDKLIRVVHNGYGGSYREYELTVVKILKSRVVLEMKGLRGTTTYRAIVRNSKTWDSWNGRVEENYEGKGTWDRDGFALYTPGDPFLVLVRERFADMAARDTAKRNVRQALVTIQNTWSNEDAEATIVALQKWIEVNA